MTHPPEDNLKDLWKNQHQEPHVMSIDKIRARAQAFQSRIRRRIFGGYLVAIIATSILAQQALNEADPLVRAGEVVTAIGIILATFLLHRPWPGDLSEPSASAETVLTFHRQQLSRRRKSLTMALGIVTPSLIGLAITLTGLWLRDPVKQMGSYAPIAILLALWLVVYWILHRRRAQKLERELEDM